MTGCDKFPTAQKRFHTREDVIFSNFAFIRSVTKSQSANPINTHPFLKKNRRKNLSFKNLIKK